METSRCGGRDTNDQSQSFSLLEPPQVTVLEGDPQLITAVAANAHFIRAEPHCKNWRCLPFALFSRPGGWWGQQGYSTLGRACIHDVGRVARSAREHLVFGGEEIVLQV